MSTRSIHSFGVFILAAALGAPGCGQVGSHGGANLLAPSIADGRASTMGAGSSHVASAFNSADFVPNVDNPYFPLVRGTVYSYAGVSAEGMETIEVKVTRDTKVILGVAATVVRDQVYLNASLIEDTFDWYAQDKEGNVWYLGEDTKEYRNGVVVSTAGSFEAGKNGATAGIIMEAHPKVGDAYQQEHAAGVAEDMARVLSLKETVSVPYGTFEECVRTVEWTPLEPGHRAFKYYARGVGPVLEVSPRGGRERVELTAVSRR